MDIDPGKVSYLKLGEEAFGPYDRDSVEQARREAADWFAVPVGSN